MKILHIARPAEATKENIMQGAYLLHSEQNVMLIASTGLTKLCYTGKRNFRKNWSKV